MKKLWIASLACVTFTLLAGCGGSVKRPDGEAAAPTGAPVISKYSEVAVNLSDSAKKALVDNIKFDTDAFASKVRSTLSGKQLIEAGAPHTVNVTITGVRVRGTFSAVMFGIMAGTDSVDGDVTVLDKDKKPVKTFKVSATYGLGGFAGGVDSLRLGYLYEKFADLTAAELSPAAK
jgi:hypothetical protein